MTNWSIRTSIQIRTLDKKTQNGSTQRRIIGSLVHAVDAQPGVALQHMSGFRLEGHYLGNGVPRTDEIKMMN